MSLNRGRNQWKFGGDAMMTWDYNCFPSLFGGEYVYDNISVNPFAFVPQHGGLYLTPLRAWAHDVPRYCIQSFGNPVSHPDSNDYAGFVQDTARVTPHFSLSLGARYDLQTFRRPGWSTIQFGLHRGRCRCEVRILRRESELDVRLAMSGR
jgi:outer membrane receptor protein involved in Fe transport